jgi:hypothetical protein
VRVVWDVVTEVIFEKLSEVLRKEQTIMRVALSRDILSPNRAVTLRFSVLMERLTLFLQRVIERFPCPAQDQTVLPRMQASLKCQDQLTIQHGIAYQKN